MNASVVCTITAHSHPQGVGAIFSCVCVLMHRVMKKDDWSLPTFISEQDHHCEGSVFNPNHDLPS